MVGFLTGIGNDDGLPRYIPKGKHFIHSHLFIIIAKAFRRIVANFQYNVCLAQNINVAARPLQCNRLIIWSQVLMSDVLCDNPMGLFAGISCSKASRLLSHWLTHS